jgi:hypothetical protein
VQTNFAQFYSPQNGDEWLMIFNGIISVIFGELVAIYLRPAA